MDLNECYFRLHGGISPMPTRLPSQELLLASDCFLSKKRIGIDCSYGLQ